MKTLNVHHVSRRLWLRGAVASAAAGALPAMLQPAHAQGTGYEVSAWSGPLGSFSLVDTEGRTWQPADFRGRAVLLNFWATWCPPCRAEMPALQQLADRHGADRLLVLAINFKEPASRARKFVQDTGLGLPVLLDVDGRTAAQWDVRIFPTTLLIDAAGQPQKRVKGEMAWTGPVAGKLVDALFTRT
jgi:thiol-disulfide isomerase/thioredoxin